MPLYGVVIGARNLGSYGACLRIPWSPAFRGIPLHRVVTDVTGLTFDVVTGVAQLIFRQAATGAKPFMGGHPRYEAYS